MTFAPGPYVYAPARQPGTSQWERCWARRRRWDRTASEVATCGNDPVWPSGLCDRCHRVLADPSWWDRLTGKAAA